MKKIILTVVGILVIAGGAFAMSDAYVSGTYRYKITVNVQTPDGIKSGSAIREVTDSETNIKLLDLPDVGSAPRIKGEAVVIDLGEKGKLFGLITYDSYYELFRAFPFDTGCCESTVEGIKFYNDLEVGQKAELENKKYWPQFVMFEDLSDPMSVKAVNKENISEQLGGGYSIQNIMIDVTDEQIRWGISKVLPWIFEYRNKKFDGQRFQTIKSENKIANSLSAGSFTSGEVR